MPYLDHIRACNNFDASAFRPFRVGGERAGHIRHDFAEMLRRWPDVFQVSNDAVQLDPALDGFDARSAAVAGPIGTLADEGVFTGWRGELYPVKPDWVAPPSMQLERAACPFFGIRAYGVHLNGYVRRPDGLHMWVARRARDKATFPGQLDNIVAGGQPVGLSLVENLLKECEEEAAIPADIARRAVPVGMISYTHQPPEGCKPDQMFVYDLEVPADFTPTPADGEVEAFHLWPIEQVAEVVRDSFEFKFNCNLVVIDFLLRHGVLDPDTEPDYAALVHGLRAGGAVRA